MHTKKLPFSISLHLQHQNCYITIVNCLSLQLKTTSWEKLEIQPSLYPNFMTQHARSGVPILSVTVYPFSSLTDEHVGYP